MAHPSDDGPTTRRCDLPWRSFQVNTQVDPPLARPCREAPWVWTARDFAEVGSGLQAMRRNLLSGDLADPCRNCSVKPLAPVADLVDLLARDGLVDDNRMLTAMAAVAQTHPTAPPPDLTYRVAHTRDADDFLYSGLITVFDFMAFIAEHDRSPSPRVLDWGCGSGRMSIHIAEQFPGIKLTGCDIDAEAVAWCREHIPSGEFHVIDPAPPTTLPRGGFTSIIAYSIVTHLSRELQTAWVAELHDLLADDGILVLTTMGATAAGVNDLADRLEVEGIIDDRLDETLDTVMPAGYYRSTFQSRTFTERMWGGQFDVLEYVDGGAFGYQDVVVLRKRSTTSTSDVGEDA